MLWVVQNNMFSEEGFSRLLSAFERLGSSYVLVKTIPFTHELVPDINPAGPVVVMGTYTLCNIARERGWWPGSFHNEKFDYDLQNYYWPMLNGGQDSEVWKLADVPHRYDRFFIRPVHDSKSFIGQVMDWPSFDEWRRGVLALTAEDQPTVTGDTYVVVAPVREIWREYRLWVVDGHIVTSSLYKFGTIKRYEEGAPEWVLNFARKCIREWTPARAFVMDVAETPKGLRVVEVNNLNAAGFYAGDMQKLVAAIEAMGYE